MFPDLFYKVRTDCKAIMNLLLTSFARSVRESIACVFYRKVKDLAPSSLGLYEKLSNTFPYRPRTRLIGFEVCTRLFKN